MVHFFLFNISAQCAAEYLCDFAEVMRPIMIELDLFMRMRISQPGCSESQLG